MKRLNLSPHILFNADGKLNLKAVVHPAYTPSLHDRVMAMDLGCDTPTAHEFYITFQTVRTDYENEAIFAKTLYEFPKLFEDFDSPEKERDTHHHGLNEIIVRHGYFPFYGR